MYRKLLLAATVVVLASCDREIPGMAEFEEFCEKDAEYTVNEVVHANGYYIDYPCAHCWEQTILRHGFEYLELNVENPWKKIGITEKGLWRIQRNLKGSEKCNGEMQALLGNRTDNERYSGFVSQYCLSVDKLEKLNSEYGVFSQSEKMPLDDPRFYIKREQVEVRALKNGQSLGRHIDYMLAPTNEGSAQVKWV